MLIALLSNMVNGSNHTKCISLNNQKCIIQPTLINMHSKKYSQEFYYHPFAGKLDKCVGNYDTLNGLSNKIWVLNKTEDLSLSLLNMIAKINESKISTKHISWEYSY